MNRTQRLVLVVYCLLLVYCCIWIPWHVEYNPIADYARVRYSREGYGWLWAGPQVGALHAEPDIPLFLIRLLAATSVVTAMYLLANLRSSAIKRG